MQIDYVNKEYFETHKNITIRVKMDKMGSSSRDKKHQIWLWGAIDHETGEAVAFWFGTGEHKNPDRLLKLLDHSNPARHISMATMRITNSSHWRF
jgi:IS1 family transposase